MTLSLLQQRSFTGAMDSRLKFFVNVLTVLLIHEVLLAECDSKIKTRNHLVNSYADGFQRKQRQAPAAAIDPSRMYLPPKINSIASSGFGGGQASITTDFAGGGDNNGYGATVPNAYAKGPSSAAEHSGYDLSAGTTLNGVQTTAGSYGTSGSGSSSSDRNSDNYNTLLESGGNNDGPALGTTSSTPNNYNDVAARARSADSYGQNELLSSTTTQNQGLSTNNFVDDAEASRFGQNLQYGGRTDIVQNAASAGGYGSSASTPFQNDAGSRNSYGLESNGNFGLNTGSGQRVSSGDNGGYGNTPAPDSFDQTKPGNGDYSQTRTANTPDAQFGAEKNTDDSYNRGAYGRGPAGQTSSAPNFNNPGTSQPTADDYNRAGFRGQQISSASQYDGQSSGGANRGAFSSTYGQRQDSGFGNPTDSYYYTQNSRDFNSFTSVNDNGPRSSLQGSTNNNYVQSGSHSLAGETYDLQQQQGAAAGLSNSMDGLNRGGQLRLSNDGYGQWSAGSQPLKTEGNFKQSVSNVPTTAGDEGHNRERQSNGPANNNFGFGQSQPGFPRVSNNYGDQIESQIPSSSGRDCGQSDSALPANGAGYSPRGSSSNAPNGFGQINRPITPPPQGGSNSYDGTAARTPSSTRDEYSRNNQNSANSYTRGGSSTSKSYGENDAGTGSSATARTEGGSSYGQSTSTSAGRNFGLPATGNGPSSGQRQSSGSFTAGYEQRTTGGAPCGQNGPLLGSTSTVGGGGTPADSGYGNRDQKKHSTFVPKDRYQNSNSPPNRDSATNVNGDYGEPGSNAFSNFAPGNRPNQPPTNTGNNNSVGGSTSYDSTANNGEPGLNAFSNFAPGNRPNQPPQSTGPSNNNCDDTSSSNQVNNASKLTQAIFSSSSTGYY